MKVLALAASNSSKSINRRLVSHAADLLRDGLLPDVEVEMLDLNDYEMPIYSQDREEADGVPEQAKRFFAEIGRADALLISYAEHNGSFTVAFKNVYDWASRIDSKLYQDKPMVLLATSPGGRGGAGVLAAAAATAPFFGGDVRATLAIPSFHTVFDSERGVLTDEQISEQLVAALSTLA